MGVAKNDATAMVSEANAVMRFGGSSSSSGWVKRLRSPEASNLKRSFTRAFFSYNPPSQGPKLQKRPRRDFATILQNAAAAATAYDSWIRRWRRCQQPLPHRVMAAFEYDTKQEVVPSVGAMALVGRSMGYSHSVRFRKSTSLVAWS